MAYEFWNKSEDPPLALLPAFLNSWMQQLPYWTKRLLSSLLVALLPHQLKDLLSHRSLSTLSPSKLQMFHVTFLERKS